MGGARGVGSTQLAHLVHDVVLALCDTLPDDRLVDKFAKEPIPVHVVDVDGYANMLETGGPAIPLTEETKERVVKEMECAARPVTTSVDEATWNAMVASLEATPTWVRRRVRRAQQRIPNSPRPLRLGHHAPAGRRAGHASQRCVASVGRAL